jgi:hypothetical protein
VQSNRCSTHLLKPEPWRDEYHPYMRNPNRARVFGRWGNPVNADHRNQGKIFSLQYQHGRQRYLQCGIERLQTVSGFEDPVTALHWCPWRNTPPVKRETSRPKPHSESLTMIHRSESTKPIVLETFKDSLRFSAFPGRGLCGQHHAGSHQQ